MLKNVTILYEQDKSGWWVASIPEVPGAFSQGRTRESARKNVLDAMRELMLARRESALKSRSKGSWIEKLRLLA